MNISRNYQIEILEQAKLQNIVCYLDTGAGKTHIAIELIKHIKTQHEYTISAANKILFFVVSSTVLVDQHYKSILKYNIQLNIKTYRGAKSLSKIYTTCFSNIDLVILQDNILLQSLEYGYIQMKNIKLIIFDECHHCTRNHPYNLIMQRFYFCTIKDDRPKILGLTASPIKVKGNLEDISIEINNLLKNLDCKLCIPLSNQKEVRKYVSRPDESRLYYNESLVNIKIELKDLFTFNKWEYQNKHIKSFVKKCKRLLVILSELGMWSFYHCCQSFYKIIKEKGINSEIENSLLHNLLILENLFIKDISTDEIKDIPKNNQISSKITSLVNFFQELMLTTDQIRGIIFVQTRTVTKALSHLLNILMKQFTIKFDYITSNRKNSDLFDLFENDMNLSTQKSVLNKFNEGDINVLVSTNLTEEILDISPCHLVIRFNEFQNTKSYIQSRGRARSKESQYIVMIPFCSEKNEKMNEYVKIFEKKMRTKATDINDFYSDQIIEKEASQGFFEGYAVPVNSARFDIYNSVRILTEYCSKTLCDSPEYQYLKGNNDTFCCIVKFCNLFPLKNSFVSDYKKSKDMAKKSVVMNIIKNLYEKEKIDLNFKPKFINLHITNEKLKDISKIKYF